MCGCFSCCPYWGPGLQPRHESQLGIEPVTLWFEACTQSTELHQPGPVRQFVKEPLMEVINSITLEIFQNRLSLFLVNMVWYMLHYNKLYLRILDELLRICSFPTEAKPVLVCR